MRKKTDNQSGFSIPELIIVLVVIAVVLGFAVAQFGRSRGIIQRQTIATEFKVALERARFDSVKRRPANCADMSRVEIASRTSFRYLIDLNQDGVVNTANEYRVVDFGPRSSTVIAPNGSLPFPIIIRFDRRGNTSSGPCGTETAATTPTTFCELPCSTVSQNNATGV